MKKWAIAGRMPSSQPQPAPPSQPPELPSTPTTLQQFCVDRLVACEPQAVGQALHELRDVPHLQQQLVKAFVAKPKPGLDIFQLSAWLQHRKAAYGAFEAAQRLSAQPGPSTRAEGRLPREVEAKQDLLYAIKTVSAQLDAIEEAFAKEMERVEDTWLLRMDGKQERRYGSMMKKSGW